MFPSVKRNLYVVAGTIALIVLYLNGAREIDFEHAPRSLSNDDPDQGQIVVSPRTQLNILTLGGSVTWGASLDNRDDAFPFRLRGEHNHNVHNLAIRGTGKLGTISFFFSGQLPCQQCLPYVKDSMVLSKWVGSSLDLN